MQIYRICLIRENGRIYGLSKNLLLDSDYEALEAAKRIVTRFSGAKVWQGARLVGALPPNFLSTAVEVVYAEGIEAHLNGVPRTSNPGAHSSVLWIAWEKGWNQTSKKRR